MIKIEPITGQIFRLSAGLMSAYVIKEDFSAVLVDTGMPHHGASLLTALNTLQITPPQLRLILLTHRHLDHTGGAAALQALCAAKVVIHRDDAAAVSGRECLSPVRGKMRPLLEPLVALSDRFLFRFTPCPVEAITAGWQEANCSLIHLPGHTPGHSGYLHHPSGVIFCGDAAIHLGHRLRGPSRLFSLDPAGVRQSLLQLAELRGKVYCFGHGPPLWHGAAALHELAARV